MAARPPLAPAAGLVLVGVVRGARGLKGEVRVSAFTVRPADLAAYGPLTDAAGTRRLVLAVVREEGAGQVVARIEGVADRTAAEGLKGLRLYLPRQALPAAGAEEFYHADLVGLRAELAAGGELGTVRAVRNFGAGDLLEVAGPKGVVLVPFTRAAVPAVDVAGGRLVIEPPAGLLEPPEEGPGRRRPGRGRKDERA